ncbi:MAG: CHAT domain-containing protein, partial [Cyclobacteriaceae bacterium]
YTYLGDYDKALYHDLKALEVARLTLGEFDRRLAISHSNIANTYYGKKNYTKALEHCQRSLTISQQLDRPYKQLEALSYGTILSIYRQTNDLQKVKEYTELNLIQTKEAYGENTLTMSDKYSNLVAGLLMLEEYSKALQYQRRSIEILKKWPNRYWNNKRNAFANMGNIFRHTGNYDSALHYLDKAWAIVEQEKQAHPNALAILNFKAYVYDSLKSYSLAEKEYEKQQAYLEQHFPTDTLRNASFFAKLGNHYKNIGQYKLALESYQEGLNMICNEDILNEIITLPSLDNILNKKAAFNLIAEKSRALYASEKTQAKSNQKAVLQHLKTSLALLDQLKSEQPTDHSRVFMYQENLDLSLALVECLVQQYESTGVTTLLDEALQYATQSQSLRLRESLNDSKARRFAGIPEDLLDLEADSKGTLTFYRQKLEQLTARTGSSGDNRIKLWTEKIAEQQNRLDSLQNHFRQVYPDYYKLKYQKNDLSITEMQAYLSGRNHALINYIWHDSLLYAFVLTKGQVIVEKIKPPKELSLRIRNFRQVIQNNQQVATAEAIESFTQESNGLYQILVGPIERHLSKDIDHLTVIPDSWLSWVPFEILISQPSESRGSFRDLNYLIQDFTINYAYSADLWASKRKEALNWEQQYTGFAPTYALTALQQSPELSGYGNYRNDLGPLQYAPEEIAQTSSFFEGQLFLDREASEQKFKSLEGSSQILHLAMHALVDEENPWRSKMIFSQNSDTIEDGFLHAYELYNLRLNAEMAVLSACNTGFGPLSKGEGVMSLSRAFSYAGCQSIVMSLWPAQDKATTEIMTLFYQGLADGLSKDQALRTAKLDYLENSEDLFLHPFYWANFVVSGDTSALTGKTSWGLYSIGLLGMILIGLLIYILKNR